MKIILFWMKSGLFFVRRNNMRISSLIFEYNAVTAKNTAGRSEVADSLNSEYVFTYSAASIATFLYHNPELRYIINTDNVDLIWSKLDEYDVSTKNLEVVDWSERIKEWREHFYCFYPLSMHLLVHSEEAKETGEDVLKLDNDLICKKPIDDIFDSCDCIVWDYIGRTNNMISAGRDYWGEKLCAMEAVGTVDFMGYNCGVLGWSNKFLDCAKMCRDLTVKMASVDVSPATINHGGQEKGKKILAHAEQLATNYVMHDMGLTVRRVPDYFDHHYVDKQLVLDDASFLRKN